MDCPKCDGLAVRASSQYGRCLKCGKLFVIHHYYSEQEEGEGGNGEGSTDEAAARKDSLP